MLIGCKGCHFLENVSHFDNVNTGERPTSEFNQWMRGILEVYQM